MSPLIRILQFPIEPPNELPISPPAIAVGLNALTAVSGHSEEMIP